MPDPEPIPFTAWAEEVLAACLAGLPVPRLAVTRLLDACLAQPSAAAASQAFFQVVVEGLSDRFERRLCDAYAELMAEAIARVLPQHTASQLLSRYEAMRQLAHVLDAHVERVLVPSRITLGADVAVTSVLLQAARRRFPQATLVFAGPESNFRLFAGMQGLQHLPVAYGRAGTLAQRLQAGEILKEQSAQPGTLVLDPDSRLSQLGMLPVAETTRYRLFESRCWNESSDKTLPELAMQWVEATLEVSAEPPAVFLGLSPSQPVQRTAVSLGVGGNPDKRLPEPFERTWLQWLSARQPVLLDRGGPGEEWDRTASAAQDVAGVALHSGPFAQFANHIAGSTHYAGYDSAGQHVAAACGIPLVTVFRGFPCERFLQRWRPWSQAASQVVVVAGEETPTHVLLRVQQAFDALAVSCADQ